MKRQWGQLFVKVFTVLGLAWLSLYSPFLAFNIGLDPSWHFGINAVGHPDLLFTYGPLGYLTAPGPLGNNIAYAAVAQIVLIATWSAIVIYASVNWLSLTRLFMVGFFWLFVEPIPDIACITVIVGLSCLALSGNRVEAFISLISACFLAVTVSFVKFSLGLEAFGAVGTALILRTLTSRKDRYVLWCTAVIIVSGCALIIAYWQLGGVHELLRWAQSGIQFSKGYSATMSIEGLKEEVVLATICLVAFAVVLVMNWFSSSPQDRYVTFVCVVPVFFSFKHGFVRQDGHVMSFFASNLLLLCMLAIFVRSRRAFTRIVFLACLAALAYVSVARCYSGLPSYDRLLGYRSLAITRKMIHMKSSIAALVAESHRNLQSERLEDPLSVSFNSTRTSVDVIPWDTSIIAANGYQWRPSPIFQHYAAYTAWLDAENAKHYASSRSADIILCRFQALDGRHMLWDTPYTWRSIFSNYEADHVFTNRNLMALRKRPSCESTQIRVLTTTIVSTNEWIAVPFTQERLFVEIPLRYTFIGNLTKTLFRLPPIYLKVAFSDRTIQSWRLVPDTSGNGILINYLPRSLGELEDLLKGSASHRVVAFAIYGPGTELCKFPLQFRWITEGSSIRYNDTALHFSAYCFHRQTGSFKSLDGETQSTLITASADTDHAGFMAFGNYFLLPPGEYMASFQLHASGQSPEPIATLDVACDRGRSVLARIKVTPPVPVTSNGWFEVSLPFEVSKLADDIECRVFYPGNGEIALRSVCVTQTSGMHSNFVASGQQDDTKR